MTAVIQTETSTWSEPASESIIVIAGKALERGDLLFLPGLRFEVKPAEALLFTPSILGSSKNASYDPASGRLGGTSAAGQDADTLRRFIHRFSESAASLVGALLPAYRGRIARGRASFRPAEIAGR